MNNTENIEYCFTVDFYFLTGYQKTEINTSSFGLINHFIVVRVNAFQLFTLASKLLLHPLLGERKKREQGRTWFG